MSSYVEVDKTKLADACRSYLDRRNARIEREREEAIGEQMNKRWFPAKTREQAIEKLKHCDEYKWVSEWERIMMRGSNPAKIVENLLMMCSIAAGDTVNLDHEAVEILEGFF